LPHFLSGEFISGRIHANSPLPALGGLNSGKE
jgi:hypothetical protein